MAAVKPEKCPMCPLGSEEPILVALKKIIKKKSLFKTWEHNSNLSYIGRIQPGPLPTEVCSKPLYMKGLE